MGSAKIVLVGVFFNDIPVGTTCSRIEVSADGKDGTLYMMTLGVLAVSHTMLAAVEPIPADTVLFLFITLALPQLLCGNGSIKRGYSCCLDVYSFCVGW